MVLKVHRDWQHEKKRFVTVKRGMHWRVSDESDIGLVTEIFTYKESLQWNEARIEGLVMSQI